MYGTLKDKWFWTVIGVSLVALTAVVIEPWSFDDTVPQIIARDYVFAGRVFYRDSFDQSFPGIFYLHALGILLFGDSFLGLRLFDVLLQILFVAILYRTLRHFLTDEISALCAVLYILFYVGAGRNVFGQRDVYVAQCVFYTIGVLFAGKTRSKTILIVAGIILGISITIRPTSLLFVPCFSLYLLLAQRKEDTLLQRLSNSSLFTFASLVPMVGILTYYATIPGCLTAFYTATIRFNADVYAGLRDPKSSWTWEVTRNAGLLLFAVLAILRTRRHTLIRNIGVSERALYASLIVSALAIVIVQQKFFRNHFATFFILLLPLVGIGINELTSSIRTLRTKRVVFIVCVLICTVIRFNPRSSYAFLKAVVDHRTPEHEIELYENTDSLFGARQEIAVTHYVNTILHAHSVEICSLDPSLRYRLGNSSLTPYPTLQHIAMRTANFQYTAYQQTWQEQYVTILKSRRPEVIITADSIKFWAVPNFAQFLHSLPAFDSLLITSYAKDTLIGGYSIYVLKQTLSSR